MSITLEQITILITVLVALGGFIKYIAQELSKVPDITLSAKTDIYSGLISLTFENIANYDANSFYCRFIMTEWQTIDEVCKLVDSDIRTAVENHKILHKSSCELTLHLTDTERNEQREWGNQYRLPQALYLEYGYVGKRGCYLKNYQKVMYKILIRDFNKSEKGCWKEALPNELTEINKRKALDKFKEIDPENNKHPNFS